MRMILFRLVRPVLFLLVVATFFGAAPRSALAQPLPDRLDMEGRVVDRNDAPIKGATLHIQRLGAGVAATFWGTRETCDDKGRFRVAGAESGEFMITVMAEGFGWIRKQVTVSDTTLPLTFKLDRLVDLSVRVLGNDGQPLRRANIRLLARGPFLTKDHTEFRGFALFTDDQGVATTVPQFCADGRFAVLLLGQGAGYAFQDDLTTVEPGSTKIDMQLKPGGTINVTVQEVGGRKLGGAVPELKLTPAAPQGVPAMSAAIADLYTQYWSRLQTRDPEGTLTLQDVVPSSYTMRAGLPGFTSEPLNLEIAPTSAQAANLTLKKATEPVALDVKVVDKEGRPVSDAELSVYFYNPDGVVDKNLRLPSGIMRSSRTDKDGRMVLYPVYPGNWQTILLRTDPNQIFMAPWENNGLARARAAIASKDSTVTFTVERPVVSK